MNKKNTGIGFGTVLWFVLSFFAAVVLWLFVKYGEAVEAGAAVAYISNLFTLS